jgi:TRAP-type mannitol/chloroaromatic compound transport system substrate-binding protein
MHITAFTRAVVVAAVSVTVAFAGSALAQQSRTLKIQSAVPPATTTQDALKFFADRVDKLTGGQLKIDALPGGAIVPPFEILDATHKKVIDGAYGISYWWFGKNKAATLFANTPAGIAGMDAIDFIGWVYDGGGLDLWNEFYQKELKLNLVAFPSIPPSPQAMGWFKRPIKDLADFRGMKCRQTGIVAELYSKMGMAVVNMPGGEILPAAERGTIDCAEWVGGVEDQRLGLHTVWKYHYTPGMHESASVAEIAINKDVWDSLPAQQKEAIKSATSETFLRWWATWQRMNADAIAEFVEKHKVQLLTTPPEVNKAFLRVWDEFAAAESAKNPFFKKVYESQRAYASKVVTSRLVTAPSYNAIAGHYWTQQKK